MLTKFSHIHDGAGVDLQELVNCTKTCFFFSYYLKSIPYRVTGRMGDHQQGPQILSERIQKLKQLQDNKRSQQLKPYLRGSVFKDTTRSQQHQQKNLTQQQATIQKKKQQNVRPICPISNTFIPKGQLFVADCLHGFHIANIHRWVEETQHLTCPVCRRRTVGFTVGGGGGVRYILGNRHYNIFTNGVKKGGWVAQSAKVSRNAIIRFNARVYDDANVFGNAHVFGNAQVFGDAVVFGNALVTGNAQVFGVARVTGDAQVHGNVRVTGNAQVFGNAVVYGNAQVYGNARVTGDAQVFGDALVYGDAQVYGNAQVTGDAQVYGEERISGDQRRV